MEYLHRWKNNYLIIIYLKILPNEFYFHPLNTRKLWCLLSETLKLLITQKLFLLKKKNSFKKVEKNMGEDVDDKRFHLIPFLLRSID